MTLKDNPVVTIVRAMRVYQWSKNGLLFAALIFAKEALDPGKIAIVLQAFAAFCMAASATYLFNDLMDVEKDRQHPKKRHRPIASGAMSPLFAYALLITLFAASALLSYHIRWQFLCATLAYIALTLSYTLVFKNLIILDVLMLAMGFVIRALAGAIALDVKFSSWLVVCTLFLALFLGLSKRRHEVVLLEEGASSHRAVLYHYSVHYLDQLILIAAGGTIITYTIYTCSPDVIERLGTDKLYVTLPFVIYGLFRYLFIVHHKTGGGDPSATLIKDWPLGVTVLLWGITCAALIYVH
jgi:4-hydroxybenzoate polyprenyltransferase